MQIYLIFSLQNYNLFWKKVTLKSNFLKIKNYNNRYATKFIFIFNTFKFLYCKIFIFKFLKSNKFSLWWTLKFNFFYNIFFIDTYRFFLLNNIATAQLCRLLNFKKKKVLNVFSKNTRLL